MRPWSASSARSRWGRRSSSPEVIAQALNTKGLILQSRGRLQEGGGLLQLALDISLANDLTAAALRSYNNLAAFAAYGDRHREGLEFAVAGLELARRVGARMNELRFLSGMLTPLVYLGRWDEAVSQAEDIRPGEDLEALQGVRLEMLVVAVLFAHRGEFDRAREVLSLLPEGGAAEDLQTRAAFLAAEASVLLAEGRPAEAMASAEGAAAVRDELGIYQQDVKEALVHTMEAAMALGDLAKVEATLQTIGSLHPGELTPYLQAEGARFGARLAAARDEHDRVEPGFRAAIGLYRDLAMPYHLAVTLFEHGEWLTAHGPVERAEPLLAEARRIFDDLKASPWLERVSALQATRGVAEVSG